MDAKRQKFLHPLDAAGGPAPSATAKTPFDRGGQCTPVPTRLNPGKSNDPVSVRNCSSVSSALARIVPRTSANCPASNGPTGPASDGTTRHHSSNDPAFMGVAISRTLTRPKPAAPSNSSSLPFSDNENGPGILGGGTGIPRVSVIASKRMPSHGLSSRGPHTENTTRPRGT